MKKLYSYSERVRGGVIEGMFVSDDESLKDIYDKSLYYGEYSGKHPEVTMKFWESYFTATTVTSRFY